MMQAHKLQQALGLTLFDKLYFIIIIIIIRIIYFSKCSRSLMLSYANPKILASIGLNPHW